MTTARKRDSSTVRTCSVLPSVVADHARSILQVVNSAVITCCGCSLLSNARTFMMRYDSPVQPDRQAVAQVHPRFGDDRLGHGTRLRRVAARSGPGERNEVATRRVGSAAYLPRPGRCPSGEIKRRETSQLNAESRRSGCGELAATHGDSPRLPDTHLFERRMPTLNWRAGSLRVLGIHQDRVGQHGSATGVGWANTPGAETCATIDRPAADVACPRGYEPRGIPR